jgi:hypothetical protein
VIVTPFGDFEFDNPVAEEAWLDAHARKHHAETAAAKLGGGGLLHGPIDGDWFARHWGRHLALATYQAIDLSSFTQALALPRKWRTEQQMIDWHELHGRIHLKQDRQLKLT